MSPIIYTPHSCDTSTAPDVPAGSLWECPRCGNIWEFRETGAEVWDDFRPPRWELLESPTRGHAIAATVRGTETARAVWHG